MTYNVCTLYRKLLDMINCTNMYCVVNNCHSLVDGIVFTDENLNNETGLIRLNSPAPLTDLAY